MELNESAIRRTPVCGPVTAFVGCIFPMTHFMFWGQNEKDGLLHVDTVNGWLERLFHIADGQLGWCRGDV
jgi:hypothetical protein